MPCYVRAALFMFHLFDMTVTMASPTHEARGDWKPTAHTVSSNSTSSPVETKSQNHCQFFLHNFTKSN